MKATEPSEQPRNFILATVLLMLLSVSTMLAVGLGSNFESATPARPGAQAVSGPVHQGAHLGALRGRFTRWAAYFARSG